jgi:hypothetical protein
MYEKHKPTRYFSYFPYSAYKKLRECMEIKYYIAFSNETHFVRPADKVTNIQSGSLNFHAAVKDSVLLRCDAA